MNPVRHPWPSGYLHGEPSVIGNQPKKAGGIGCRGKAIDLAPKHLRFNTAGAATPAKRGAR